MKGRGLGRIFRELALTLGAVLGALLLAVAVASVLFGVRPLVVQSGSMSPAIETGALAFARTAPGSELQVGDVVTVRTATGSMVTHRIVDMATEAGQVQLRLKGDANETPDSQTYTVDSALRVFADVPMLGYVVAAMTTPVGLMALGAYGAFLVWVIATAPRRRGPRGGRRKATAGVAAGVLAIGVGLGAQPAPVAYTQAAWVDPVDVTGTTLAAYTVPPPVVTCGTLSIGSTRLNWSAVPGATGYTLNYGSGGGTVENVGPGVTFKTFSGLATSGVFSVRANINYGSTTWTSVSSNAKNYTVLLVLVGTCTDT